MAVEDEVKLQVDLEFELQHLDISKPIHELEAIAQVRTVTLYFDSPEFELAEAKVALRFRYRVEEQAGASQAELLNPAKTQVGVWALKTKGSRIEKDGVVTTSRQEYEITASYGEVPGEFVAQLNLAQSTVGRLGVIAAMDARRDTQIISTNGHRVIEIDDDTVTVLKGATRGETFREIELELLDENHSELRSRLVHQFLQAGAIFSKADSKLQRVLGL